MLAVTTANCFGISLSIFDLLLPGDDCIFDHLIFHCIGESFHFDHPADLVVLGKDQVAVMLRLQFPMHALHRNGQLGWWVHVHFHVFTN